VESIARDPHAARVELMPPTWRVFLEHCFSDTSTSFFTPQKNAYMTLFVLGTDVFVFVLGTDASKSCVRIITTRVRFVSFPTSRSDPTHS